MEVTTRPCEVCASDVEMSVDTPEDTPVLCPLHFFEEDVTEEWEAEDE